MKNKTEGALRSLKSTLLLKIQEVRSEQSVKISQILKTAIFEFWNPSIFDFDMYQKKGSNFSCRKIIARWEYYFSSMKKSPLLAGFENPNYVPEDWFQKYILEIVFLPPTLKDTSGILAVK